MKTITSSQVPYSQTVKLFIASLFWFIYLFFIPYIYSSANILPFFLIVFPGGYLFCLLALFMHECWHEYLPGIHNKFFYSVLSWMIFLDHQIFDIVHPSHHSQVNTYQDIEFYPLGEIKKRSLRVIYNFCEVFLGNIFLVLVVNFKILHEPKLKKQYSFKKLGVSLLMRAIFWGGIGYSSHLLLKVNLLQIVIPYALTCWMGSLMIHHSELIEHGNLIVEGKLEERNLKNRNLKPHGVLEKCFLFLTNNHSLEHSLHHSKSNTYTRPFPQKNPMSEQTVYISFAEYSIILKDMLTGKCSKI
ncbi:fatty acid desaturase [Nostoc sp. UHCC 0302]|uniref:fatty acid desaturase n=1 Tax=Nostoc sp. UHCC 0302 TaxID=3134896 RepID=UPI00311CA556